MPTFKRIFLLGTLYFLFGRLALQLALPPGYASPIWPAAGIALAFVLIYGNRVWLTRPPKVDPKFVIE